jgi:hypothetical protein
MKIRLAVVAAFALILGACSSAPSLLTKPATVPAGINFSGNWVASGSAGSSQPSARELSVHVFLEMGKTLKVTQTASGLFFSFDRSVVEEYRFGENRIISVGEISAERASGWEGNRYVIETLDEDGAHLIETYRLEKEASVMLRTIVITYRNDKKIELEQVFNRA